MRLLQSSLLCAASATIAAASAVANVYTFDHDGSSSPRTSSSETIDAETSRLIFAQRLGLSQFHTLKTTDDEALRRINAFGGRQRPLFAADKPAEGPSKVMIVVEGVEDPMIPALASFKSFSISPAPHPSDSYQLWSTFSTESSQLPQTGGPDYEVLRSLAPLSEMKSNSLDTYNNRHTLLYVKSVATAAHADVPEQLQILGSTIEDLYNVLKESDGSSLSIVFMPSSSKCSKHATNAYGLNLSKRAAKAQREQILSESKPSAAKPSSTVESTSPFLATKVLKGAIPTCFSSKHNCETGTNNCTSHGSCILKFSADVKNSDGVMTKSDCYGCACKDDVKKNKEGEKTTRFGGAACNKKDIVMPFWLIGGSSVLLIFIVSWGMGLLYSMGSEELPSVIGAGVSGPKARGG
ncbi:hypothetical protein BLS_008185 [Venturia inaequalis]|uniref:DUF3844 domain-containing protein n=1 Tax=Venturia inaequalis TaxID=5025 RepID=A0A8H3YL35_VENIN|nr:hypothetical protein BLS_008185 [Venturia inaequalis]